MTNPRIKSIITYDIYRRYFSYALKHRKGFKILVVIAIIAVAYFAYVLISTFSQGKALELGQWGPFAILALIYIAYFVIYYAKLKTNWVKHKTTFETPLIYDLYSDKMTISLEGKGEPVIVPYKSIKLVLDAIDCWYVVINSNKAYMISKNVLAGDTTSVVVALRNIGCPYKKI